MAAKGKINPEPFWYGIIEKIIFPETFLLLKACRSGIKKKPQEE